LALAIVGIRSEAVAKKAALHLGRFRDYFWDAYGHERLSACVKRDVVAWQASLTERGLSPATVNNHLASLSACTTWIAVQYPGVFPNGDPTKGIGELTLPPLEPRAFTHDQVRSLKNLCDRLERFHQLKGRRWAGQDKALRCHAYRRPLRDRAIVFTLLSTGLRREELVQLDLNQLEPNESDALRVARKAKVHGVRGKGKTARAVFLSADARAAVADYLEKERCHDAGDDSVALFLSARPIPNRSSGGRLSPRSINLILAQIGLWHDAEIKDPDRRISPLRPHDLRHTFAFFLAETTGADPYELERRLGHRSQRYIQRYTNPPEHVAAAYVEDF